MKLNDSVTRLEEILSKSKEISERHFSTPSTREKRMTVLAIAKMLTEIYLEKSI